MKHLILRFEEQIKLSKVLISYSISKVTANISPRLAGLFASKVWFTPLRNKSSYAIVSSPSAPFVRTISSYPHVQIKTYGVSKSSAGTVVLVHGWGGSSKQFERLTQKLLSDGFCVVVFDFPGHGTSRGLSTDLWEMKEILKKVLEPLHGPISIVCHSFGLFVIAKLLAESEKSFKSIVTIASPHRFDFLIDQFMTKTKLDSAVREELIDFVQLRVKNKMNVRKEIDVSPSVFAKSRWLFIHDEDDREVSFQEFTKLYSMNPNAETLITQGLGHNRILQNDQVLERSLQFLRSN